MTVDEFSVLDTVGKWILFRENRDIYTKLKREQCKNAKEKAKFRRAESQVAGTAEKVLRTAQKRSGIQSKNQ